jgi:hypothetical protein
VVFGLAGALVWLELKHANQLPAWMRIPRRSILVFLAANAVIMFLVPIISGAAHVGGFAAGLAAAGLVAGRGVASGRGGVTRRAPGWVRAGCGLVALATALAVAAAGWDLFGDGRFEERYTARLLQLRGVSPFDLQQRAEEIARARHASPDELSGALRLAERAAVETRRREPTVLATLAEVQLRLGLPEDALVTVEEALRLDPGASGHRELRSRILQESPSRLPPGHPSPADPPEPARDSNPIGLEI